MTALDLANRVYGPLCARVWRESNRVLDRAEHRSPADLAAALASFQVLAEEIGAAVVASHADQAEPVLRAAVIETEAQKIMNAIMERAKAKLYAAVTEKP